MKYFVFFKCIINVLLTNLLFLFVIDNKGNQNIYLWIVRDEKAQILEIFCA